MPRVAPRFILYGLAIVGTVIVLLLGTWWLAGWNERRKAEDDRRPPVELTDKEVLRLPDEASRFSPLTGRAPVVRRGTAPAPEKERKATKDFAKAVLDTTPSLTAPLYPQVRVSRDEDVGMLAVLNSRMEWDRQESRCPEGRRWEAGTQDSTMFFNCERAVPGLLPKIGKTVVVCGLTGLAGWGIAEWAGYDQSEVVGVTAGGLCTIIRIF